MQELFGQHEAVVKRYLRRHSLVGRDDGETYLRMVASGFSFDRAFPGYVIGTPDTPELAEEDARAFIVCFDTTAPPEDTDGVLKRPGQLAVLAGCEIPPTGVFIAADSDVEVSLDPARLLLEFRLGARVVKELFDPFERVRLNIAAQPEAEEGRTAKGTRLLVQLT